MEHSPQSSNGTAATTPLNRRTRATAVKHPAASRRGTKSCVRDRDRDVDTGLKQILNMRVGCWRPPIHVNSTL